MAETTVTFLASFQRDVIVVEIKLLNTANLSQVSSFNNLI